MNMPQDGNKRLWCSVYVRMMNGGWEHEFQNIVHYSLLDVLALTERWYDQ